MSSYHVNNWLEISIKKKYVLFIFTIKASIYDEKEKGKKMLIWGDNNQSDLLAVKKASVDMS